MSKLKEKISSITNSGSFTAKELFSFASGSFGNCMGQDCVGTYTDQFFYDYMGLSAKHTIPLKTITKGVNIISSPIIGLLLDNSMNARRFMTAAAIPLTLSSVLLFYVPTASLTFKVIYSFIFYLLFNVADTFYDISLLTLSSRMTDDTSARKTFYTVAQFASTLGSALPGGLVPVIIDIQKGGYNAEKWAFFAVALTFGILGFITMIIPCFTLKERVLIAHSKEKKKSASINLKLVLLNRPLLLLSLSQIIDSIRQVCYSTLPFLYKQTIGDYSMKTVVEVASSTLSYIGLASVPVIGKKLSSRDMVSFGYLHTGLCYILLGILGYKSKLIVGILIAIAGFPNAGMSAARRILLADSADYMEWKSYKKLGIAARNEGMIFSFNTMCTRISSLWKDIMIDFGLKLIGYKSAQTVNGQTVEAVQTPQTLKGIFLLVVIPGIIGNIFPGLLMRLDNFNGTKKQEILKELYELREQRLINET